MIKNYVFLVLLVTSSSNLTAGRDTIVGAITKTGLKTFAAGLTIGIAHGILNQVLSKNAVEKEKGDFNWITFSGSHALQAACGLAQLPAYWGHGIGQCVAESIDIKNRSVKFSANTTLFAVSLVPIIATIAKFAAAEASRR